MVPPLFLDVHPDHYILDMCAAPGSKTFQLLEIIHQSIKPGSLPYGLVVANDADVQRCNLLIHQTKRMCSANLIVTNHEAQFFPNLPKVISRDVQGESKRNISQFDRILCDVPCSGDGTLRKAPDIWRKWKAGMGNGLHRLQVDIAMRGVTLLKVGGRMVYSTCSMNPVENEAVVAEVLRRSKGSVKLLDVSLELPELVRRPGLNTWKVRDKGHWLDNYEDVPISNQAAIFPSLFPPNQSCTYNLNEPKAEDLSLDLECCMRILPHDQDSGAFFIAVLHKISSLNDEATKETAQSSMVHKSQRKIPELGSDDQQPKAMSPMVASLKDPDVATKSAVASNLTDVFSFERPDESGLRSQGSDSCSIDDETGKVVAFDKGQGNGLTEGNTLRQDKWRGVDPVVFFRDENAINSIRSFYGISESFPLDGYLVTRSSDADHVKRIYYISNSVHELLELNIQAGLKLKITSLGLKVFERQSSKDASTTCIFRLSSEGLPLLLPHIGKQILSASVADFRHLLQFRTIKFSDFVDADFREKASALIPGCCVIAMKERNEEICQYPVESSAIAIVCWKGKTNLSVLVSQVDSRELLDRLAARFGSH